MPFLAFCNKGIKTQSLFSLLSPYISNTSPENNSPSPDGRENPFVVGFTTKDWKEQRETASSKN
jgi:hypothetical protein